MSAELSFPARYSPPATASLSAPAVARSAAAWTIFRHPLGAWLLLVVAALAVYAPALGGEFLWDDHYLVKGDVLIRSPYFFLEVFRHTLFEGSSNFYRPVQRLTYMWDYAWWETNPFGYHLTNALIHACNGFLLFALLRRLLPSLVPMAASRPTATDRGALAIALLWVVHPVHSAAVAYIAGRADSLAMAFCVSAWLQCARALLTPDRPWVRAGAMAGAFLCFLAGLCSKEIAFVWLVLFAGWLFAVRPAAGLTRGEWRNRLLTVFGGGLAVGVYLWLRHLPPAVQVPPPPPGMLPRWLLMLRALGDYGRLMLFPDRLYMERQVFTAPGWANAEPPAYYAALAVMGAFVLAAFAAGAYLPGRGRNLRRAGAGWFLVGFLPISNLFPLNASVAEHWLYLPSVGFLLFLAGVAHDVPWTRLSPAFARPGVAVTAVLVAVAALGGRTWLRAHDWTDSLTFYRQTISDGGDFPRMREGLALAYVERGAPEKAVALLNDLVARYPHLFSARANLASIDLRAGRKDEARAAFEGIAAGLAASTDRHAGPQEVSAAVRALDQLEAPGDPAWASLRQNLLGHAAERYPESWELVRILVADRERAGDPVAALSLASHFADAHWWHLPSHLATGQLLAAADRPDEALAVWRQVVPLDVHDASVPAAAAALCLERGRPQEAIAWQQTAVRRQPGSLRQHLLMAQVFARVGRAADAEREREAAARLVSEEQG